MGKIFLFTTICLSPIFAMAQPVVQVAAPSQEALWEADNLYFKTMQLPKEQQDWQKVALAYKKSADMGHPEAMRKLGDIYARLGNKTDADKYHAMADAEFERIKKSADDETATYQLILNSEDCAAPRDKFEKLAKEGTIHFNTRLGEIYTTGKCGDKDVVKGNWFYSNGAILGSPISQIRFADYLSMNNFIDEKYGKPSENKTRALAYYFIASKAEELSSNPEKYDKTYALKKFESLKADYLKTSGNRKYFNKFIGDLCGYQQACTNLPPDIVNPILDNKFDLKKAR